MTHAPGHAPTVALHLTIAAPIERVWQVLTDLRGYADWNPFITRVDLPEGDGVGSRIALHVRLGERAVIAQQQLVRRDPPDARGRAALVYAYRGWLHGLGLVRATREQTLERLDADHTRYATRERFTGRLARFVPLERVSAGFHRQATALRRRCERWAAAHAGASVDTVDEGG